MASFSFGTGNADKLLRLPLYAAGRIGTLIVPRGRTWVFGCGAGIGDGALALLREAQAQGHRTLWLVRSPILRVTTIEALQAEADSGA